LWSEEKTEKCDKGKWIVLGWNLEWAAAESSWHIWLLIALNDDVAHDDWPKTHGWLHQDSLPANTKAYSQCNDTMEEIDKD